MMMLAAAVWMLVIVCDGVMGDTVVVNTPYGALTGTRIKSPHATEVDKYLGVPFAKPPVGNLRFQKPVANDAWTGTRNATSPGPVCPQLPASSMMDEDCLYLNVFTPKVSPGSKPLPVMVWIHGGGFTEGTGSDVDLSALAAKGVVAVSINYRLGALGFLSTEDAISPGNYGLHDQIRALVWVHDAISFFNGDPDDVTIFGQSAGGASIALLVLSTAAQGLFHKAIMESGVSLNFFSIYFAHHIPEPRSTTVQLAAGLDCDVTESAPLLACLRTKSVDRIVGLTGQLMTQQEGTFAFGPVAESTFRQTGLFTAAPEVLWRHGHFSNVTTVRGFNKDEMSGEVNDPENDGFTEEEFKNLTRMFVYTSLGERNPQVDMETILPHLYRVYLGNDVDPLRLRAAYQQMVSDYAIVAPVQKETQLAYLAQAKPQFLYQFSYRSANRQNPVWKGAMHGDEIQYVLGYPLLNITMRDNFITTWTEDDRRVSIYVTTMWTNFAKYGNPTPHGSNGTQWSPWTQAMPQVLDINMHTQMRRWLLNGSLHLWNNVIPKLLRAPGDVIMG